MKSRRWSLATEFVLPCFEALIKLGSGLGNLRLGFVLACFEGLDLPVLIGKSMFPEEIRLDISYVSYSLNLGTVPSIKLY